MGPHRRVLYYGPSLSCLVWSWSGLGCGLGSVFVLPCVGLGLGLGLVFVWSCVGLGLDLVSVLSIVVLVWSFFWPRVGLGMVLVLV